MGTGFFTFKWNDPSGAVQEVYVTGTFDAWGKSTQLFREGDDFVARVELPVEKTQYKFVVDGEWVIDPSARKEFDGVENNILIEEDFEGFEPQPTVGREDAVRPEDTGAEGGGEDVKSEENDTKSGGGRDVNLDDEGNDDDGDDEDSDSASESGSDAGPTEEENAGAEAVDTEAVHVDTTHAAASEPESESSFESEVADVKPADKKVVESEAIDAEGVHVEAVDEISITSEVSGATSEIAEDGLEAVEITPEKAEKSLLQPPAVLEPTIDGNTQAGIVGRTTLSASPRSTTVGLAALVLKGESSNCDIKDATISTASPESSTVTLAARVLKETPRGCPYNADGTPKAAPVPKETPEACPYNADGTPKAIPIPDETPAECPYNPDGSSKTPTNPVPIPNETPAKCPYNLDRTPKAAPIPAETPEGCPYNADGTPKAVTVPKETPAACPYNADGTPKTNPDDSSDVSKKGIEFLKSKPHVLMGVATIVGFFLTKRYLFSKRGG